MLIYKLKSNKTGLFSMGGSRPSFSKVGKIWKNIGHLRNHVNQLDARGRQLYKEHDIVMVTYEIVETEVDVTTFDEMMQECADRKAQRAAARQARITKWQEAQERKQLELLKKKYEK